MITTEETIKYTHDNWTIMVSESQSGGINYTLYAFPKAGGQNWILTNFDTAELVALKQMVDMAVANAHSDRDRLLS